MFYIFYLSLYMQKPSAVRERIENAALNLFYDQGFLATGINQLVEEADISKSTLYQHFNSKEDLLIAYLTIASKQWLDGLLEMNKPDQSPATALLTLFDYRVKLAIEKQFKGCAFVRIAYELPNLDPKAAAVIQQHKSSVKQYIKKQIALLNPQSSSKMQTDLTETIYTLYEGCGIESTLLHSVKPIENTRSIVSNLIN